ncbi:hypothetical protein [Dehalococcoides mccartyi]|uniref:hypothetical protein n=1 Tax=Dehalococcoides mccartyi TaxID=61435 RepID=UPI0016514D48|nr:hypothetical protein [Dehalococcoides mccartyi]
MIEDFQSKRKISSTKTTNFGTTKRENHDSSLFYGRKLYNGGIKDDVNYIEN